MWGLKAGLFGLCSMNRLGFQKKRAGDFQKGNTLKKPYYFAEENNPKKNGIADKPNSR